MELKKTKEKMQKENEKKKSKVEALQNCDRGSFPLSFLLLVLRPAQRSIIFFKDRV